jgi:hypothetical protein
MCCIISGVCGWGILANCRIKTEQQQSQWDKSGHAGNGLIQS